MVFRKFSTISNYIETKISHFPDVRNEGYENQKEAFGIEWMNGKAFLVSFPNEFVGRPHTATSISRPVVKEAKALGIELRDMNAFLSVNELNANTTEY